MKTSGAIAICAALVWCAAQAGMTKPQHEQYFVLDTDRTRTEVHQTKHWVVGLRAGTYKLIGEDHDGEYFQGEGDCALFLIGEHAERYIQTGEIVPLEERQKTRLPGSTGGVGGIWLPKPGVKKEAMLYWALHVDVNPSSPQTGIVVWGIAALVNGSLAHHYLGKDLSFLGDLNIVTVP